MSQQHGQPTQAATGADEVPEPAWKVWLQSALLAITLYVFLVSIGLLGSSFKLFGKSLASQLIEMTSNPMAGLLPVFWPRRWRRVHRRRRRSWWAWLLPGP